MDLVNDDTWEHGDEQLTYTSGWKAGQPNNYGYGKTQDCTILRMNGWDDVLCSDNYPFLCEVEY